jgi:hypothetical protein|tara:strand:- start:42 stop:275 length:234 start_codon:yes stop_codon:yes gene_type:complete
MMILKKVSMILINYITKNDLAKSLGVSLSTIDRKLKELPHYKWGSTPQSRVMFKADEIVKYFDSSYAINKTTTEENQ